MPPIVRNYRIEIIHGARFSVYGSGDTISEAFADACTNLSEAGVEAVPMMEVKVLTPVCAGDPVIFSGSGARFKQAYNIA